jgi:hypothetical protein
MFEFLKNLFRKKKVEEVKKVEPEVSDFKRQYNAVKNLRPTLTNNKGSLSVSGLTPKTSPKVTPSYYGHHHSPRSSYLPTSQTFQPHPNQVVYDDHDSITGSNDSLLMGIVVGALADEALHSVSKSVETHHHTPAPEPVHVTPSSSSSEYSSPSSDSYSSSSSDSYSSSSRSDSYSSSSSSDYSSSSSSDYSSSSSDSGSSWSD